jgi:phosphate transport system substrate-binding protein
VKNASMQRGSVLMATAAAVALVGMAAPAFAASPATVHRASSKTTLLETGSTLLYPLFNIWVPAYTASHKNIQITTGGTGSGTGIAEAESGAVQIGASDAYLPPNAKSTTGAPMLNIPLAISAQMVNYNLPGLNNVHLKLSGAVLAGIYSGKITKWNAAAIKALNPMVKLPDHTIIPMRRGDSSGDTFIFTTYMTDSAPKVWTVGYGTTVSWPALKTEVAETGNSGMVSGVHTTPYSIAYIGISYLNQIQGYKLGEAELQNKAGNFLLPTAKTIGATAAALVSKTPKDETLSMIYGPGANSYPIVNYEYAIVSESESSATIATAVRTFIDWAITSGNASKFLNQVHFQPLPESVVSMSRAQAALIK